MDITITSSVIIAIIIGIANAAKGLGLNQKFIPIFDILLGLICYFIYSFVSPMEWPYIVFYGLLTGLTACGLYSGVKNTAEGFQVTKNGD